MDVNGLTNPRVVTPADGQTRPELLADAAAGHMDETVPEATRNAVAALLDGRTPSRDAQGEAYRLLLVAACNGWHAHMPFMFEKIRDYTELLMPEDLLSQDSILSRMRSVMADEDCQDVEIIGWLYQFYISEKKDQVFAALKKNVKITAENIPAATQLFTPHWIVRYLVENSLGRLWLLNRPQSSLATRMDYYIAPDEPETDFLRVAKPEDIRICDPACGSGHMLTYAFDLLHAIYEEEGYDAGEIPALILTHNLHGIEIDDRAGALASFALVMKAAAKIGRRRFLRFEVLPHICVMQNVRFAPSELQDIISVVGRDMFTTPLQQALGQFERAKSYGSLIRPSLCDPATIAHLLHVRDADQDILLQDIKGRLLTLLAMAEALRPVYHVVVANPPYMGGKGMNADLAAFVQKQFPDSKSDLFAIFMEVAQSLVLTSGLVAMVNMQSWMFLSSFEKLRSKLLAKSTILSMAHLGERGFDTVSGAVVSTTAFVLSLKDRPDFHGDYLRLVTGKNEAEKAAMLRAIKVGTDRSNLYRASQKEFASVPGGPIVYWLGTNMRKMLALQDRFGNRREVRAGMSTSNNDAFLRYWHEVDASKMLKGSSQDKLLTKWHPYNKGGGFRRWYGNNEYVVNWLNNGAEIKHAVVNNPRDPDTTHWSRRIYNTEYFYRPGVAWGEIANENPSFRVIGDYFINGNKSPTVFGGPDIYADAGFLNSKPATVALNGLNPTMGFNIGSVESLPVPAPPLGRSLSENVQQLVRISKDDWDSFESSWDYSGSALLSLQPRASTIEECYSRLQNNWADTVAEFQQLEEENNRLVIHAYGLTDEISPAVSPSDVTLMCNPAYRYGGKLSLAEGEERLRADTIAEFLQFSVGCMFGRYSIDAPGLILANQGEGLADYFARVPNPRFEVDADNVIPVLEGEWFADDITERIRKFLRVTFGEERFQENLAFIEGALGKDIRKWFTREFFDYHVRRYKKRPIYWMFCSPKGTFNALIYMHRYRPDTVSVVLNDYLRELISKLQAERARLEKLADDASVSQAQRTRALKEAGTVVKQIDELTAWERDVIFPLAQAKIEIDLDDGVKVNYPKFGAALKPIKGLDAKEDE